MPEDSIHTGELHHWVDRIHAGDSSALDGLLKRANDRLDRLARKLLRRFPRVQRWADAEDVLQNVSLRLIRSLKEIRPQSMRSFYGLAATHLRRELLDMTRSLYGPEGHGANHDSGMECGSDDRSALEPAANPVDEKELDEWRRFHEEVEKLPSEERETVGLIFYHGWTQADAAELFGVSVRTIQRWWQSAMVRLQARLAEGRPIAKRKKR